MAFEFTATVKVSVENAESIEDARFIVNNALGQIEHETANDNQFTEVQMDIEFVELTEAQSV